MIYKLCSRTFVAALFITLFGGARADGDFDMDRWNSLMDDVRTRAVSENISNATIDATLNSPMFIPSIIKNDKNQKEFRLDLDKYLSRMVTKTRVANGRRMRDTYPTLLHRVQEEYGIQPHVILAFWGLESNYGRAHGDYRLKDSFFTLMYDGRREKFFGDQLLALMKIADDNKLDIDKIQGSWAGAMGHFQFIPTTLATYGCDGNDDGKVDIINNVSDAMFSAGNYLNKLGWNKDERIVRRVVLPHDFNRKLLDGKTKKNLSEWAKMGVVNPDGSALPKSQMSAGLIADLANVADDAEIIAYLTYPNFYRIKKWNNSNWYAIAIAELADRLK